MAGNEEYAQKERDIFAANFKRLLTMRGKTQSDVATYLGVRTSTVSDWAKARKYPRVDKMQMIADYLGVIISDLREQPGNFHPAPQKELPLTDTDEEQLNQELITRLCQLTPEELEKVDAFVQGILAAR